jgi:cell wall-associated NlpC family hydrolase
MTLRRIPSVVVAGLVVGACSSLPAPLSETPVRPGPVSRPEYVIAKPPPSEVVISPDSEPLSSTAAVSPGVPRLVWVPEWKLYLREGIDAVAHDDRYYLYARGGWYAGETDRGPWRAVAPARTHHERRRSSPSAPIEPRAVAQLATRHVGRPYAWGGASPQGFDCSGFVMYVYGRVGVALPHNAARQYAYGTPVRRDELEPGDLVFFDRLRHNGIYIGDGKFVHASKRGGVKISRVNGHWFRERWTGARRVVPHRAP